MPEARCTSELFSLWEPVSTFYFFLFKPVQVEFLIFSTVKILFIISFLYKLSLLIFLNTLCDRYYYDHHFMNVKIEAQGRLMIGLGYRAL